MARDVILVDRFAPEAEPMRGVIDARFEDPRSTRADRFVWDYWHVPGQYTALRTPAWHYFPAPLYRAFHERLVWWGRRTLGCHDISPPWLSCYVEGCRQELHGDLPHGPWAFVFSLTRWSTRKFRGGETLLLRGGVLDYWDHFVSERHLEERELVRAVPSRFNRLVVFDPRVPHGVRRVEGTHDPREGRLVVHGWFVQPRPFVEGPLPVRAVQRELGAVLAGIGAVLPKALPLAGLLSVGVRVSPAGQVTALRVLSDTTRVPHRDEPRRKRFVRELCGLIATRAYPRAKSASHLTLPFVFAR